MKKIITAVFIAFTLFANAKESPLWLRNSAISPDGSQIAFTYKGNIFTVPVTGGKALQITSHTSHDTRPVWSNDGSKIAFASDREGGFDVFLVSKEGGIATRLTSHSANEYPEAFLDDNTILFSSHILPVAENQQFPSSMFTQLYQVDTEGGRPKLFSPLHFENISIHKEKMLYTDKKGYEDTWRKHHVSSVTRDVWLYDIKKKSHKKLSRFAGENRNAVWAADGNSYFYLSEKDGSFNVFKASLTNEKDEQLTQFIVHPVRYLSVDKNDNLSFSYNGELYYMKKGDKAHKLAVEIVADDFELEIKQQTISNGARSIAVSPNGKEIAFVARGDVFVTSIEYNTTKRITDTPEQERDVHFSPDGRSLVYSAERGNTWNIYKTDLVRKEDKYFVYANELKETQLTFTETPSFEPQFSPDGKEIAYLEDRSEIRVLNLKSKATRTVMEAKFNYSYSDGDQWFQWSPDSKWVLSDYIDIGGWNNKDVALIKADGSGETTNLTLSGYTDSKGKWVLDGKAILFFSDRAGYRSHGSWGAHADAYLMFLTPDAYDEFKMTKEERELAKDLKKDDKTQESEKAKEDKKTQGKKAAKDDKKVDKKSDEKEKEALKFDLDNRQYRVVRLTRHSSSIADAHLNKEGTKLYYLSRFESGYDLWEQDLLEGSTKLLSKNAGAGRLIPDKENKLLYMVTGGNIKKIDNGKITNVSFSAPFNYRAYQEREYIFNHTWQQVKDKFYDETIHGVDWELYKESYARFLPHINNNYDFQEMLSELLGELNASHTGARYSARSDRWQTATLAAFWDESYEGDGLKIKEIIKGSPLIKAHGKFKPGVIITKIDGEKIEKGKTYWHLLDGKAGKSILITAKDGSKEFEEHIKPISSMAENNLLYNRWVEQREKLVDKYSDGRLAYIHIKGMDAGSFSEVYKNLLGKYRQKEAVVIDTRFNGGGWLHDDLATLLSGKEYQQFKPRGQYIGSDPFNKWNKPSILLMGEGNYSNAHGFPWVYKELGIGKLVGAPVPGTMTAVWWETQIDPSIVFGIPQVTVVDMQGKAMENNQLEPDVLILNTPESLLNKDDLQLKKAVEELLNSL